MGDYIQTYSKVLLSVGRVDLLLLDGPEDARETLNQYEFFLPYLKKGALLFVHDWFTEKARLVKPLVEGSGDWEVKKILGFPRSLGFALAVKV